MKMITASPQASLARVREPEHVPIRVGAVQHRWHSDPLEHQAALAEGVRLAANAGARLVCLQELTLSRYVATSPEGRRIGVQPEPLAGGPTTLFAGDLAKETGAYVHASLWEERPGEALGFNTAVVMSPNGSIAART